MFRYLILFFVLFFIVITKSGAQISKDVNIDSLQKPLEKLEHLKVRKNSMLVFPLAARSIETNWAYGVAGAYIFKTKPSDSTLRTSTIPLGAIYTTKHQIVAAVGANVYFPGEKYILRFESSFSKFPDKFWGIGNYTNNNAVEAYSFSQIFINPWLMRKVYRDYYLGFGYELQHVYDFTYQQGGLFDKENVFGREGGNVSGFGFILNYDSRNHAYQPDKGQLIRIRNIYFNHLIGSNYNYNYMDLDFRKFWRVNKNQVLAIQVYSIFNFGSPAFRNLAILGGNNIMRGYYAGRYRDKDAITMQAEYRVHVWWRFGLVGFIGCGQVADVTSSSPNEGFTLYGFKYSVGGGARVSVLPKEKLNIRVDYGFGVNGQQNIYVVLAESF